MRSQNQEGSLDADLPHKYFVKHKARLTVSAAVRLMPSPPARVLNRNTKMSSLKSDTNASISSGNHTSTLDTNHTI